MIDALIFDNLTYISMADAAAGSRLSTEYLARLARTGRIHGRRHVVPGNALPPAIPPFAKSRALALILPGAALGLAARSTTTQ